MGLGTSQEKMKRIADSYRQSHPEWFHEYRATTGRVREHYASELCDSIR